MIPLSRSSEYAIRALTHLACQDDEESYCLVRQMAEHLAIPAPFLGKCLQPLVARGLLESQRGRGGGFRLAAAPEEITLYLIVDALEHLDRPRRCVLGQADCTDARACPLHEYWKATSEAFHAQLRSRTLADLVAFRARNPLCGFPGPGDA